MPSCSATKSRHLKTKVSGKSRTFTILRVAYSPQELILKALWMLMSARWGNIRPCLQSCYLTAWNRLTCDKLQSTKQSPNSRWAKSKKNWRVIKEITRGEMETQTNQVCPQVIPLRPRCVPSYVLQLQCFRSQIYNLVIKRKSIPPQHTHWRVICWNDWLKKNRVVAL